jgi:hypothetical protein
MMKRTVVVWGGAFVLGVLGSAVGAVGRSSAETRPAAVCEVGDTPLVRDVVYFGRNRPDGGIVSDAEWQGFLDEVVTPRFPAGLTVLSATGQWRGQSGAVERERAEVLTVLHAGEPAARGAVAEVAAEYKRRFAQEAVLRERTLACTRL